MVSGYMMVSKDKKFCCVRYVLTRYIRTIKAFGKIKAHKNLCYQGLLCQNES